MSSSTAVANSLPLTRNTTAERSDRVSTFAALGVRNYRLFFTGQLVSNAGTWMQRVAQDWLVLELTNSPFAVGITTALQFLPMLLFGLAGGLLADRYPKRRILLGTQTIMGVLAAILAVLTITGSVRVWQIYAVALALGLATVADTPARQTFVGEMVPPGLVRNAVSLNTGNFQFGRMVGPAVAGLLISWVGAGWAFGLNALSYIAVVAGLALMRERDLIPLGRARRGRGQVREGLSYVRSSPAIAWTIVLVFFVGTFGYNFAIYLTAWTRDIANAGPALYGWLNTAMAAGSLVGALWAARRQVAGLRVLFLSAAGFSVLLGLLGGLTSLWAFLPVLVLSGMVGVSFNTLANATVQIATEPALRGRVMSLYMIVFMGGTPLGSVIVGALTQSWGVRPTLVLCGFVCLAATVVGAGILTRQKRAGVAAAA